MGSSAGTYTISNQILTILASDEISYLSVVATSGSVTFLGNGKQIAALGTNNVLPLILGTPLSIERTLNVQPLSGIVIDATSGSFEIIIA